MVAARRCEEKLNGGVKGVGEMMKVDELGDEKREIGRDLA